MSAVSAAEAFWQQYLQRLADEFIARVAKHGFGLRIDEDYGSSRIDHDHTAWRGFDDSLRELLGAVVRHSKISRSAAIQRHSGNLGSG